MANYYSGLLTINLLVKKGENSMVVPHLRINMSLFWYFITEADLHLIPPWKIVENMFYAAHRVNAHRVLHTKCRMLTCPLLINMPYSGGH